jgi:serine/threonine protein kinase
VQTAATDTLVGRSLEGRYRILNRIARGGMSTVYAAVDERLDRLVAVKVMSAALSADPAFTDRFAREARAAARLTHLNVVSVYDQGHETAPDGHHVFLVMELVEGRTLRELIRERGRLSPAEAISIMEPVLSALAAAHRAGLVHRDVKPENILLSDDGVVKVADFGLARAVESDAAATRTGLMMGTVAYCAPEQISEGRADPRSDVYAAGVVLFELLTGTPPYKGESAMNVAYQHVHSRVPAPSSRVKGVPNEIDEIVIAATDSDPTGRPADAGAFLAEIADARAELRLPVVPVPPRSRPRTRGRGDQQQQYRTPDSATTDVLRGRAFDTDTAVVPRRSVAVGHPLPLAVGDDTALPPPVVIPPPKARQQLSPRQRSRRRMLVAIFVLLLLGFGAGYTGWWFVAGRYARVPDLTGAQLQTARHALEAAGYKVKIVEPGSQSFSDTVKKGLVLRTDPSANARYVKGRTVTIYLSAGPHLRAVPSVQNLSPDDARSQLTSIGFTVAQDVKPEYSDTVDQGKVTRTSPAAGHQVPADRTITLYVSKGPPLVDVPSISQGTPFDDAKAALKNSDGQFKIAKVEEYSDTVPKDEVVRISPDTQAPKFSTITVTVSKGPEFVTVPDIPLGTTEADAQAQLADLGLVADFQQAGNRDDPRVYGVPDAGKKVRVGSTITVLVF